MYRKLLIALVLVLSSCNGVELRDVSEEDPYKSYVGRSVEVVTDQYVGVWSRGRTESNPLNPSYLKFQFRTSDSQSDRDSPMELIRMEKGGSFYIKDVVLSRKCTQGSSECSWKKPVAVCVYERSTKFYLPFSELRRELSLPTYPVTLSEDSSAEEKFLHTRKFKFEGETLTFPKSRLDILILGITNEDAPTKIRYLEIALQEKQEPAYLIPYVLPLLHDEDVRVGVKAAEYLGSSKIENAEIYKALDSYHRYHKKESGYKLRRTFLVAQIRIAQANNNVEKITSAFKSMSAYGDLTRMQEEHDLKPLWLSLMSHDDVRVRMNAAQTFGGIVYLNSSQRDPEQVLQTKELLDHYLSLTEKKKLLFLSGLSYVVVGGRYTTLQRKFIIQRPAIQLCRAVLHRDTMSFQKARACFDMVSKMRLAYWTKNDQAAFYGIAQPFYEDALSHTDPQIQKVSLEELSLIHSIAKDSLPAVEGVCAATKSLCPLSQQVIRKFKRSS